MGAKAGIEMKLYRNTGTAEAPQWSEMLNTRDVNLDFSKGEADVSNRGSGGWKSYKGTLKDFVAEFGMVYDPADETFQAVEASFLNNTTMDLAFADGDITVNGTKVIRDQCEIFGFKRSEGMEEAVIYDCSAKRGFSTTPPDFYEVGA